MLMHGPQPGGGPGVKRSLVLLVGRLLMSLLFLYVGWTQVQCSGFWSGQCCPVQTFLALMDM